MNIVQIKEALPILFKAKVTPLLIGHRGIGKTECIKQYAADNGYNLIELRLGQMADAGDLIGLADFIKDSNGNNIATKFMIPHIFTQYNSKFIIFLDELNRAHKDILQAVFELVYDRSISVNGFKMKDDCHVIAAMNPDTEDYDVLNFNDSAFNDRFCHLKVEIGQSEWMDYARTIKTCPSIVDFIADQGDMLEPNLTDFNLEVLPSRRSWMAVSRIKGSEENLTPVVKELIMGMIGKEVAVCYFSFLKNYDKSIKALDILNNFNKVKKMVKKHSTNDSNRQDILRNICDNLKIELIKFAENKTLLTKKQDNNLITFLETIPADLAFTFIKELGSEAKKLEGIVATETSQIGLFENDRLAAHLAKVIK